MPVLNLGIVAHVDAGKTSLTERILFDTGVTDTLALERERGITIRSAVVSFRIGELKVNLIDTPGHSDFVAELARRRAVPDEVRTAGGTSTLTGTIPVGAVHAFEARLPLLSHGEGDLVLRPGGDEPVLGAPPGRERTDLNPLHRAEYLLRLSGRG